MKKLKSLRDAVLAAPLGPGGRLVSPETLLTFAERGAVRYFDGAPSASFELSYDAHVVLIDFAGDPLTLLWSVCRWLSENCAGTPIDAVKFHVDILDGTAADVSVLVPLRETVLELPDGAGVAARPDPTAEEIDRAVLGLAPR